MAAGHARPQFFALTFGLPSPSATFGHRRSCDLACARVSRSEAASTALTCEECGARFVSRLKYKLRARQHVYGSLCTTFMRLRQTVLATLARRERGKWFHTTQAQTTLYSRFVSAALANGSDLGTDQLRCVFLSAYPWGRIRRLQSHSVDGLRQRLHALGAISTSSLYMSELQCSRLFQIFAR
jgi:hypothetical protein